MIDRREFLYGAALCSAAVALGDVSTALALTAADMPADMLSDMLIIDPHAHPDKDPFVFRDHSASHVYMRSAGVAASCYAAIGDLYQSRHYGWMTPYDSARKQLEWWLKGIIAEGTVRLVRQTSDISASRTLAPGAILGIEGGDPLEGKPSRVDDFYNRGVRIITLVHYHNNEIGDIMHPRAGTSPGPYRGGLSREGRAIVERMQKLGMVVDVAHAETGTLTQVAEISSRPLIDSHTGLCRKPGMCGRSRTFQEMELVAKTNGVVCS